MSGLGYIMSDCGLLVVAVFDRDIDTKYICAWVEANIDMRRLDIPTLIRLIL